MRERAPWFEALPEEVRQIWDEISPLADKAEEGPLSFADVNRLHALVFDLVLTLRAASSHEGPEAPA